MDHRATDRRGQLLAPNETRCVEVGRGQHANAIGSIAEGNLDFREQLCQSLLLPFSGLLRSTLPGAILFGLERSKLLR